MHNNYSKVRHVCKMLLVGFEHDDSNIFIIIIVASISIFDFHWKIMIMKIYFSHVEVEHVIKSVLLRETMVNIITTN